MTAIGVSTAFEKGIHASRLLSGADDGLNWRPFDACSSLLC